MIGFYLRLRIGSGGGSIFACDGGAESIGGRFFDLCGDCHFFFADKFGYRIGHLGQCLLSLIIFRDSKKLHVCQIFFRPDVGGFVFTFDNGGLGGRFLCGEMEGHHVFDRLGRSGLFLAGIEGKKGCCQDTQRKNVLFHNGFPLLKITLIIVLLIWGSVAQNTLLNADIEFFAHGGVIALLRS